MSYLSVESFHTSTAYALLLVARTCGWILEDIACGYCGMNQL
ncbi:hypothetical protein Hanom_Chr12g01116971 [Helianthus anomalus]